MLKNEVVGILNEIFEEEGENRVALLNNGEVLFEMVVKDGGDHDIATFLRRVEGLKEILKAHGYEMELKKLGVKGAISKSHSFAFYELLD